MATKSVRNAQAPFLNVDVSFNHISTFLLRFFYHRLKRKEGRHHERC